MIDAKDITLRKIETLVKCDITTIFAKKIDAIARKDDKELIFDLLKTHSQQDVEIISIIVDSEEKIIDKTANYIEERTIAYEKSMQYKRLIGFKRKADIRTEAREAAIQAGKEFHSAISVTSNPLIQSIVNRRLEIVHKFNHHFSNLIEHTDTSKRLELDKILKIIPY